jgi:hypothetical protein
MGQSRSVAPASLRQEERAKLGSSCGVLFNDQGQVIGINFAMVLRLWKVELSILTLCALPLEAVRPVTKGNPRTSHLQHTNPKWSYLRVLPTCLI